MSPVCVVFLIAVLTLVVLAQDGASKQRSRGYQSMSPRDVASSMVIDESNGVAYLVGRTRRARAMNTSHLQPAFGVRNKLDAKVKHDSLIAKVALDSGKVLWSRRLAYIGDSIFSAVARSRDGTRVFAAGVIHKNERNKTFMVQAFEARTGKQLGRLFESELVGVHFVRRIVETAEALFLCGESSRREGEGFNGWTSQVLLVKISVSGQLVWLKQSEHGVDIDYCAGLEVAEADDLLFVAGTSHRKRGFAVALNDVALYALSSVTGAIKWTKKLHSSDNSQVCSSDVLVNRDAVYVLTYTCAEDSGTKTERLHKLSKPRGILLWSRDTCCAIAEGVSSNAKEPWTRHSGVLVSGLSMGFDRYIYYLKHHTSPKTSSDGKHATVVRVGEYGEHAPQRDVSQMSEVFKTPLSKPQQAVFSPSSYCVYTLSNDTFISRTHFEGILPNGHTGKLSESGRKLAPRPHHGQHYLIVGLKVNVHLVSVGAVVDVLAEKLRFQHSRLNVSSNQNQRFHSNGSEVHVEIIVFTSTTDDSFHQLKREIFTLFRRGKSFGRNAIERHLRVNPQCVRLALDTVHRAENSETISENDESEDRPTDTPTFNWTAIEIVGGCFGGLAFVAGAVVYLRGRRSVEESFAAPSLHGQPVGSDGESSYYAARQH